MIRVGTSHYVTLSALKAAYSWSWESALAGGAVSVGRPVVPAGAKLFIDSDGRYILYCPEQTGQTVSAKNVPETPALGSEDSTMQRSHMMVEDLCRVSVIWRFNSIYSVEDPEERYEYECELAKAKESIEALINKLISEEKKASKGSIRWDVEDDTVGQEDGVVLICPAQHKGLMLSMADRIACHVDGLSCATLALNYRP